MADILYTVEKKCPLCDRTFSTTKVRNSLKMVKQDTDFCTYYQQVNPYYYTIWVCPHCGYAAQDVYFEEVLPTAAANTLRTFLQAREVNVDFGGVRTREQAIATYKLAIFYAEMTLTLASRLAGLWIKLAWLFREGEQTAEEQFAMTKALTYYEKASLKEALPIGGLTEIALQYLMGELLRRTGKIDDAITYLGRLVSDPRARSERRIVDLARQCWHLAREEKGQEEVSATEESK
ncbi:hypothetical protein AXX12_11245 [Anaerosporomusa subterranea]|uniref:DUF2225 domain-containing protein n=1 Tax=Anaerosporomusa subterranea TaxID=1794912 RepID=A0A154BP73_ANASB|nr:DUF2225 domain-containing protein [Anaerosporomusa subterranea]KYZ75774.1 hypothetical protein AXX12_11245 [Anaerosporomusa subterranea]